MKKIYMQYWEESERGWGVRPDGCSLHITLKDRVDYIKSVYSKRDPDNIPLEYDRIVGEAIEIEVSYEIFDEVLKNGNSLRLMQYSMNNLRKLQEIQIMIDDFLLN